MTCKTTLKPNCVVYRTGDSKPWLLAISFRQHNSKLLKVKGQVEMWPKSNHFKGAPSQMSTDRQKKVRGPLPSLHSLELGPLNPASESGEHCKLNLVHCSLKIGHLVATISIICMRNNRLNLMKIAPFIQWILCVLVQKNVPPKK